MDSPGDERVTVAGGQPTPFGRIVLAGTVQNAEPIMARRLRTLDDLVISVVLEGQGVYRGADGATTTITAPAMTVVLPGERHWYGTRPGARWTEWFAVVSGPVFDMVLATAAGPLGSGPRPIAPGGHEARLAAILGRPAPAAAAADRVWELARWLADALAARDPDRRWERARSMLEEHSSPATPLPQIAAAAGMSYDLFRHGFRERFGVSPHAYRSDRRLDHAATLLRLTEMTVRQIAERVGYADEYHLSRRFKARFGLAPGAYRMQRRS